jgi:hypothetical protein
MTNLNKEMDLTDPSQQSHQYRIFINNCNDYIGNIVTETLRNDHIIEVNPNIIIGSINSRDQSQPPTDVQLIDVRTHTHLFSSQTRLLTTRC